MKRQRAQKEINVKIGANIKSVREQARYTQEKLSEMIGLTPNHLSAIERGISGASLETVQKICRLFGVSADFLLFGKSNLDDQSMNLAQQLSQIKPEYQPQVFQVLSALLEVLAIKDA